MYTREKNIVEKETTVNNSTKDVARLLTKKKIKSQFDLTQTTS